MCAGRKIETEKIVYCTERGGRKRERGRGMEEEKREKGREERRRDGGRGEEGWRKRRRRKRRSRRSTERAAATQNTDRAFTCPWVLRVCRVGAACAAGPTV